MLLFVLMLKLSILNAKLEDLSPDPMRSSLALCLFNISYKYFPSNGTIVIGLPANPIIEPTSSFNLDQTWLRSLFVKSSWSLFIQKYTVSMKKTGVNKKRNNNYVIHARSEIELLEYLIFFRKQSWNPHAHFVIVTTEALPEVEERVRAIVKVLWQYHVLDFVIVVPRFGVTSIFDMFTWFPYEDGNCGQEIKDLVVVNSCSMGEFASNGTIFPRKVPEKLNKCNITIRTVLWPPYVLPPPNLNRSMASIPFTEGTEILLMKTVAEFMGANPIFTISVKYQDWGRILDNGSATTGLFKALITEKVDLGMASLAATRNRINVLDFTASYEHESITWCVPVATEVPKWMSILNILHLDTWIATFVAFWIVVFLIWRISLLYPKIESTTFQRLGSCSLYNFSATLATSIEIQPLQFQVRIIFIMWVYYSFHLGVAFQTSLMSKLTHPDYENQVDTLEEIFESNMEFGYISGIEIYFEDDSRSSVKIIHQGRVCENVENCLRRIANEKNFALAVPKTYLKFVTPFYYNKRGELLIYWFRNNVVSYPIHIYAYKGFPLIRRINDIILRVKSSGLMKKWLKESFISYMKTNKKLINDDSNSSETVLTYQHLQGAFILLIFGNVFALVSFICEVVYFRAQVWKKSKRLKDKLGDDTK